MSSEQFTLRLATVEDAPIITAHRRAMFQDMGTTDLAALDEMDVKFLPWVKKKIESGEYLCWLALNGAGNVVGGGSLWIQDWPATPHNLQGCRGYVLNVYVDPGYRRRGLARRVMQAILDWCRDHQIDLIVLNASNDGRPLYESMGFRESNVMTLRLSDPS